ncbi:PDCD5-related protein [Jimgerdemannia flammicorona]|uniref:PDCD5-related protein n=1 Tax=Jimgerdemannia flammicorona TaxID=994334 RepID=A0A433D1A9_9FUNG|nr:PDCD5-related protein [Jimgerdemannia flammicorona]
MEDDELNAIRARRMAELQASQPQSRAGGPSIGGIPGGGGSSKEDEEKKGQMEEMRRTMLIQILDNTARERLSRIQMVKADKARAVEDLLIRMAQGGQLRQKINEAQLIDLLGQINEQEKGAKETKIVYNRRRFDDDEEEEEYDL